MYVCSSDDVAAWIGLAYNKARLAQGKPKGNVLVIFAVCNGHMPCRRYSICDDLV